MCSSDLLPLLPAAIIGAYALTFISVLFRVAFVEVASGRLDGASISIGHGLRLAWERVDAVGWWAFVSATVGLAVRALAQLPGFGGLAGSIGSWLVGAAWGAVTSFVVPVLALERCGVRGSVQRSAAVVRERWGEEATGVVSITAAMIVAFAPLVLLIAVAGALAHAAPAVAVSLIALGVLALAALSVLRRGFAASRVWAPIARSACKRAGSRGPLGTPGIPRGAGSGPGWRGRRPLRRARTRRIDRGGRSTARR